MTGYARACPATGHISDDRKTCVEGEGAASPTGGHAEQDNIPGHHAGEHSTQPRESDGVGGPTGNCQQDDQKVPDCLGPVPPIDDGPDGRRVFIAQRTSPFA